MPIPLETIKLHYRVNDDKDDAVLNIYDLGAIQQGESLTNRVWPESLFTGTIDKFSRRTGKITITKSPCIQVNRIRICGP
ncbi:MAG: phage head-tail connector protein [Desulfovibrio sp.]|nr:phage head-tail connector protein [Desulfovibrio sp.]